MSNCPSTLITFRVSRRPREMYIAHERLCVCLCVCLYAAAFPHYCTDPDVTWGMVEVPPSCALWGICNRCTGFVVITTYHEREMLLVLALFLVYLLHKSLFTNKWYSIKNRETSKHTYNESKSGGEHNEQYRSVTCIYADSLFTMIQYVYTYIILFLVHEAMLTQGCLT